MSSLSHSVQSQSENFSYLPSTSHKFTICSFVNDPERVQFCCDVLNDVLKSYCTGRGVSYYVGVHEWGWSSGPRVSDVFAAIDGYNDDDLEVHCDMIEQLFWVELFEIAFNNK